MAIVNRARWLSTAALAFLLVALPMVALSADEKPGDAPKKPNPFKKGDAKPGEPELTPKEKFLKALKDKKANPGDGGMTLKEKLQKRMQEKNGKPAEAKPDEAKPIEVSAKLTPEQLTFFESKIRPVLIESCYKCHAEDAEKIRGGLTLDTRDGLRTGGDTGPAIVPGNAAKSLLIEAMKSTDAGKQMPPTKRLSAAVIADFETWVKMGAPDPRDGTKTNIKKEIDLVAGRTFWAFQSPKATPAPMPSNAAWAYNDVDRFILSNLETKALKPVEDADAATLVRRVYLDLIGLPPLRDDVAMYVSDAAKTSPAKALENLIDRLLANPAFGERWGRHWLDVARYGESTGKAVNFNFPHAWRYRDYVIDAFNTDRPYDRFIMEQLAGDLLPASTDAEKARNITGAGYLAIGTKAVNERSRLQFELDLVDEQIDAFSQAFLGITAACARCHDHKFDPIPTRDYYALAGIFRSTETCYGTIRSIQAVHPASLVSLPAGAKVADGMPKLSARERTQLETQIATLKKQQADLYKTDGKAMLTMAGVRITIQMQSLEAKLNLYDADGNPKHQAMSVREKSRPINSPIYQRGELDKPGETVPRGTLQVLTDTPLSIGKGSGRLELAQWVASPTNPLTARVYVNRVWQHLFGRGIVPTPDNFGATGNPPANQALLDSLALWFTANGSSTKALIKHLMLSHTYQLSSKYHEANHTADPDNALCWRMTPSRLDAETLRDSLLAVSGNLNATPPAGSEVAKRGDGYAIARGPAAMMSQGTPDETHRSVYLPIVRDMLPESLALFDAADPSLVTGERSNTTVPSQALFLLNNPFVLKQSESAATKVLASGSTDTARITFAYKLFYGRTPNAEELQGAESFLTKYTTGRKTKRDAYAAFCQALFGSAEFLMRR